jgi:hypothetical protein
MKIGMQVLLVTQTAVPFKWDVATLPYSGPAGSKNISARINNHALIMGKGTEAEREATWQVYRWLLMWDGASPSAAKRARKEPPVAGTTPPPARRPGSIAGRTNGKSRAVRGGALSRHDSVPAHTPFLRRRTTIPSAALIAPPGLRARCGARCGARGR